ncbi:adenosine deaminase protein [Paramyrothecium foliicola]|nr:adenosine deaminase protein [Paramyrothecium foliicola]
MCNSPLHGLLVSLPKVEHHLHIEGTLEPELLFSLAAANGVVLPEDPAYASAEALLARYARFTSLDFLGYYYAGMAVLVRAADFETLAWRYFERAAAHRVRHAEVFFDPQAHTARGVAYDTVVEGLAAAKRRAQEQLGMTVEYIVCVLRHLPLAESHALVDTVLERKHLADGTLVGFGMVSSEKDFPPELFADLYARVAAAAPSANLTAHAGEEAGPEFVRSSLDKLGVSRIDHGRTAAQDPSLLRDLAERGTLLTLCPWSNVVLQGIPKIEDSPIRALLDAGVPFSLNSDDPAYFRAYIQDVYCRVQDAFQLSVYDWERITKGAVEASWCQQHRKDELFEELAKAFSDFKQPA